VYSVAKVTCACSSSYVVLKRARKSSRACVRAVGLVVRLNKQVPYVSLYAVYSLLCIIICHHHRAKMDVCHTRHRFHVGLRGRIPPTTTATTRRSLAPPPAGILYCTVVVEMFFTPSLSSLHQSIQIKSFSTTCLDNTK
jgi:hypothetical protein